MASNGVVVEWRPAQMLQGRDVAPDFALLILNQPLRNGVNLRKLWRSCKKLKQWTPPLCDFRMGILLTRGYSFTAHCCRWRREPSSRTLVFPGQICECEFLILDSHCLPPNLHDCYDLLIEHVLNGICSPTYRSSLAI